MRRTFIQNRDIRSVTVLSQPMPVRATWLGLVAYSSDQADEHQRGGVIANAATFTPAMWRAITGAGGGRKAVDRVVDAGLAYWRGGALELALYDHESEGNARRVIAGGRKGGLRHTEDGTLR